MTKGGVARYGGPVRFVAGAALELVFSFLQGAVSTIRTTIFMIGLAFGKSVIWGGQSRDAYGISWSTAVAEPVAADAVRRHRVRAAAGDRAGRVLVEPAADRRLSRRDPVRGGDRLARARPLVRQARPRRHPRRLRPTEGSDSGVGGVTLAFSPSLTGRRWPARSAKKS